MADLEFTGGTDDVFKPDVAPDVFAPSQFSCPTCGQTFGLLSATPNVSIRGRCHCGTLYEVVLEEKE